nr:MAG TPA: hypothetical protein [Caudoviricetes sp.]
MTVPSFDYTGHCLIRYRLVNLLQIKDRLKVQKWQ